MKRKKWFFRLGWPLVMLGGGLLGAGYPTRMNDHNWYLVLCLVLVLAGAVLYVSGKKGDSKY